MPGKNFTVYKSSAGSGKTFTLVKEYLALALNDASDPPQAYKHILAVTFTNKAAAEMKERIIKALKELSEDNYDSISKGTKNLLQALKEDKKINLVPGALVQQVPDDSIIRKRAQRILTAILHNYSDFAIGTIDSFVHKVVRTFAFDLQLPMSFEIEMDDEKLLTQAIDLLIAQIGNDELLTKVLVEFAESKTDDEKSWHIENDLKNFAKNLLNEEGAVYIDKLRHLSIDDFFKIKDTLFFEIKKFESHLNKCGETALEIIKVARIGHECFAGGENGIGKYFSYLAHSRLDKLVPSNTIQKNIDADKWYAAKATGADKENIDGIKSRLIELYDDAWDFIQANLHEFRLFNLINRNIYSLAVLNEIEKILNEYKTQNNVLHISEFNKMIAKIVSNEPIPFIYERLGERYNNYLIDEFQDTSVLQFQNLLPLIDNSLASGHFTMLVGDGKQAIYRWRGGEVEQFAMLPEVFKHDDNPLVLERQEALARNHNPKVLDKNYRSKREVIEFNNSIFRVLANKLNPKYQNIYENLEQGFSPENTGGFVQVEFIEGKTEDFRTQNKIRTQEIILHLLEQNYKLKDIAILVRKNSDGSDIANYLTENGIEVISSDSLLLSNSAEINFLHSLLKYLSSSADSITHAEILEYLVATNLISKTTIHEALLQKNKSGLQSILRTAKINFNANHFSKMALYELCEELIRTFKLNAKPNAYIQFFLDEVLNYTIKKNNNLNDFIEYWEEKKTKASLVIPQGIDAVNIMTIHRSKGLEFPVVILPFSNSRVDAGKKNLWIDLENKKLTNLPSALVPTSKDLMETPYSDLYEEEKNKSLLDNLNVLYVALTRAEERMYILTGIPSKIPDKIGNVSDMLAHYYQMKGEWKEEKMIYTYGLEIKSQESRTKNQVPTTNYELQTFNSNQWRDTIKMRAAAPSIWNTQAAEVKKDYGVMVHTALAKIKVNEDVEPALISMCSQGLINLEEKEKLQQTLSKIIKLPKLQPYFMQGLIIKNEMEIITSTGEFMRPDRVILNEKTAVIVDYKTGGEKPKHKEQILQYADLLSQMGYAVTEKLLVYIEDEKVVEC
ncbi:MAG: UvrD-helicase domain-containing protein [Bacteroidetes bacterium]|nr:UvrD-helicase domain-containing protein [Bacteroidota bacterium]